MKQAPANPVGTTDSAQMFGRFIIAPTMSNNISRKSSAKQTNIHNSAVLLPHSSVGSKLPNQRLEKAASRFSALTLCGL